MIVARVEEADGEGGWLVGVASSLDPVLREASSPVEAARLALEALEPCPLAG